MREDGSWAVRSACVCATARACGGGPRCFRVLSLAARRTPQAQLQFSMAMPTDPHCVATMAPFGLHRIELNLHTQISLSLTTIDVTVSHLACA